MARNLREALDDVVTKITWRPDKTALVHDAEALNTLIGYIVMETVGHPAAPSPALTREALAAALLKVTQEQPGLLAEADMENIERVDAAAWAIFEALGTPPPAPTSTREETP